MLSKTLLTKLTIRGGTVQRTLWGRTWPLILQSTPWDSAVASSISYMGKLRSRVSDSSVVRVTCGLPMNWRVGSWGLQSQPAALAAASTSFGARGFSNHGTCSSISFEKQKSYEYLAVLRRLCQFFRCAHDLTAEPLSLRCAY